MRKLIMLAIVLLSSFGLTKQEFGSWVHLEDIDLITDEANSFIVAGAIDYPQYADLSGLFIRCSIAGTHGIEAFFHTDRYLGSGLTRSVTYRFDSDEALSAIWNMSTTGEALFVPQSQMIGFMSELNRAEQFILRVDGVSAVYTYVTPVDGLNDAMYRLGCYAEEL